MMTTSLPNTAVATAVFFVLLHALLLKFQATKQRDRLPPALVGKHSVAIIGAGFGGIATAKRCLDLGIPFTIYEMAHGFGGTWLKNTYPGSGCDVPSHAYSFSWRLNPDWTRKWVKQEEIMRYANQVAKHELGLDAHTKFLTKVRSAKYEDGKWTLEVEDLTTGEVSQHEHTFLMSAVGQLNIPSIPQNFDSKAFQGEAIFHSAEWPKNLDLTGKRVAVIGTGASAIQFVPELAKQCKQVDVFQRSKFHVFEKVDYAYPAWALFAFKHVPLAMRLYRAYLFLALELIYYMTIPNAEGSWANKFHAKSSAEFMRSQSDASNADKLVPDEKQVLGCKRLLLSSEWCALFKEGSHVRLHTSAAQRITAKGVDHVEADIVVFGTGFKTGSFLDGLQIRAVDKETGKEWDLHRDVWGGSGNSEAYRGVTVPHIPNFAMCYAANTNLNHSSIISIIEAEVEHFCDLMTRVILEGKREFCVKPEPCAEYNAWEQARLKGTTFSADCDSWYKRNATGKILTNWHGGLYAFWQNTAQVKWEDYTLS